MGKITVLGLGDGSEKPLRSDGTATRIAILEDHRLMREMLFAALAGEGFEVEAAGDPAEFFQCVERRAPEVAIVDLTLDLDGQAEPADGFEVLRRLRQLHPSVRLLVFSASTAQASVDRALRIGAQGYLFKASAKVASLCEAIARIMDGKRVLPQDFPGHRDNGAQPGEPVAPRPVRLTERERQVLNLVGSGASNLAIAGKLRIKERTVKAHVSSLYRKLGSENRVELALLANSNAKRVTK